MPFFVLARALFGHQWTVEARRGFTVVWDAPSGGWSQSGQRIRTIAGLIERGQLPPDNQR